MRTWFVIAVIVVVTIVYSIAVMAHMLLFRDKHVFFLYARSWSRILLKLAGIRVNVQGADRIQPGKRYVYAANHSSLFDIPVMIASIPDNIRIMYKQELRRIPVFGWCLHLSPYIAINRQSGREASDVLGAVVQSMSSGASVLVFPEGTRSEDGTVGSFRRGVANLASRSKTPVLPVSIIGTAQILPARTKTIRGGDVELIIDDVISTDGITNSVEEKNFTEKLRSIIAGNVNTPDSHVNLPHED